MAKYLVIAALLALLLLLVYSRLYPYIQAVKKLFGVAQSIANPQSGAADTRARSSMEQKLVRCVACGTWIPADRAIGSGFGSSVYCSRECIEKKSNSKERKIAG